MTILHNHFSFDSYVLPQGDNLMIIKLPESEGRVLYCNLTDMSKLGFWMAYVLPGKSFDASNQEAVLAALYQKNGEQFSYFFKLLPVRQIPLSQSKIMVYETAFLFPPVKAKELEKIYINKLIQQMAEEYQKIQGAFIEARYEEVLEELDKLFKSQKKKSKLIV